MVPVDEQGASSSTASNGSSLPFQCVGCDSFGFRARARADSREAVEPHGRTIDRGNLRACKSELRGFSAGRGAQVGNAFAAQITEQIGPAARRLRPAPTMLLRKIPAARRSRHAPDVRTVPVGNTRPRKRSAQDSASCFTVRSRAGSWPYGGRDSSRGIACRRFCPALEQPIRRVT